MQFNISKILLKIFLSVRNLNSAIYKHKKEMIVYIVSQCLFLVHRLARRVSLLPECYGVI